MSALAALLPLAAEDAATEGKKVITAMLIVGLVFAVFVVHSLFPTQQTFD